MDQSQHERALRAVHRETVLALMGTFSLYEVPADVETVAARALFQIVVAHPCGVARPRYGRGRAAMRALLNEIERPDRESTKSTKSDVTKNEERRT
ncbi:MAG: hypothetical protein ACHREM_11135 [Polyangiales bacterium]